MNRIFCIISLFAVSLTTACSSGSEFQEDDASIFKELRNQRAINRSSKKSPQVKPKITREILNQSQIPFLEISVAQTKATAYLAPIAYRKGQGQGEVVVWSTEQGQHIILRNGILIGTRGLGGDLSSADVSLTSESIANRSESNGLRTLYVRDDNNANIPIEMRCSISKVGPETIVIVGKQLDTLRMQETCTDENLTVTNDYWANTDGTISKSRQWAGPRLGYLGIRQLEK